MEAFGVYHVVAFVESNQTHGREGTRDFRMFPGSSELNLLQSGMFGPSTPVSVDQYVNHELARKIKAGFLIQHVQRDKILEIWKEQGMTSADIGILSDADEVFSRDFLRAMQICDVPRFRPGQDCKSPKVVAATLVFEGSPNCITANRRWFHPDAVLGECIHGIGNETKNPPVERDFMGVLGPYKGGGRAWNEFKDEKVVPLWNEADYRNREGGGIHNGPMGARHHFNAFHFHNFFVSHETFSWKYTNRAHKVKNSDKMTLEMLDKDAMVMVNCARGQDDEHVTEKYTKYEKNVSSLYYDSAFSSFMPIAFQSESYRNGRHSDLQHIIMQNERGTCWSSRRIEGG